MTSREEWRPISGWGGRYEVSSLGRVRSLWRDRRMGSVGKDQAMILKTFSAGIGYRRVRLYDRGRQRTVGVHLLALEAFVGPAPNGAEASHLDGDPANNRLDNLAWESHGRNNARKAEHGTQTFGETHPVAKMSEADATRALHMWHRGVRQTEIARVIGVHPATISSLVTGRSWAHIPIRRGKAAASHV